MAARIELAPVVLDDFDRILEQLALMSRVDAVYHIDLIAQAIDVLAANPEIGRPANDGLRELVIGRRTQGYVALYRYVEPIDTVFVLAVRAQRERGFERP